MFKQGDKVSCKKVLGQTICHVGASLIIPKHPVTIKVYNSSDCGYCPKEIKNFKKKVGKLGGFAKVVVTDIENADDINFDLLAKIPVADFDNGVYEQGMISKMNDGDIIRKIMESARNAEMMRSYK